MVETIKNKFCAQQQMHLTIYGRSFGALTALDIPSHRPTWINEDAAIHIKYVIADVPPNGKKDREYSLQFLENNFSHHTNYRILKSALIKLLEGKIKDSKDYIENIAFNLAPLYSAGNK